MSISKVILPQLERRSKQITGRLSKGFVNSSSAQSLRSLKLSDIVAKFQQLKSLYPQLEEPLKLLRFTLEKYKQREMKQSQIQLLESRAFKAEEKINQLRGKLKKMQTKYAKDISEIVKMKILAESSFVNKNNFMLSCNQVQITRKITEIVNRQESTFPLTEASTLSFDMRNTYMNEKQNIDVCTSTNNRNQIKFAQNKISALQLQMMKKSQYAQQCIKNDIGFTKDMKNQDILPQCKSIVMSSSGFQQQIENLKKELQKARELSNCYKQQCVRKQLEQIFREKAILSAELYDSQYVN